MMMALKSTIVRRVLLVVYRSVRLFYLRKTLLSKVSFCFQNAAVGGSF